MSEIDIEDFEPVDEEIAEVDVDTSPTMMDENWTDYILSSVIREDEQYQGSPTVDGLRRVTELLLGPIICSETEIVKAPSMADPSATAIVRLEVRTENGSDVVIVEASADANSENTQHPYNKYLVAMAETRAEGRALRKVLRLRKVVAAEELMDHQEIDNSGKTATVPQVKSLEKMCSRDTVNINVVKLVNKYAPKCNNIDALGKQEMLDLLQVVSAFQSTEVPKELQGYDKDWRLELCQ